MHNCHSKLLLFVSLLFLGASGPSSTPDVEYREGASGPAFRVTSGRSLAKDAADTLYLYGGPGTDEGKFESAGVADRGGWTGWDATDVPSMWQISDFNASTLGAHGAGNLAAWCGRTAAQQPGWATAPGYGNDWLQRLEFEVPVADPSAGQTVDLDFVFHLDVEADYDFFEVQFDSAGTRTTVFSMDGTDAVAGSSVAPGLRYSELGARPIVYAGDDYADGSFIRLYLVVRSDNAWSDEDGLFDSNGAVQVDDIAVDCSAGSFLDDFESGWTNWMPLKSPFAGDFFDVYPAFTDLDPCADDTTPVAGFLDYGQDVNNSASSALIPGYPTSTGGTQPASIEWGGPFGIPGGWVVNYNGGLSAGYTDEVSLANWMISPAIDWDLPGTEDDGADWAGAKFRFDVYAKLPLLNGIFWRWGVRSGWSDGNGGAQWSDWRDRQFVYYRQGAPQWEQRAFDVTDLLEPAPDFVQIRLGALDLASDFFFPGSDATPSPVFDNVAFQKYRVGGPVMTVVMTVKEVDLPLDGFPVIGEIEASSAAARGVLDIPFDSARDLGYGPPLDTGDSVTVTITSNIPGAEIVDRRMVWLLDKNPLFEDPLRVAPARAVDENVQSTDPDRWTGEVVGTQTTTSAGAPLLDQYDFDLPDVDFLYPGDRLRFFFRATDSDGRVSTLPQNTSGFAAAGPDYDPDFEIRGLPSLWSSEGDQPPILVIDDSNDAQEGATIRTALDRLNMREGEHFDAFTTRDRGSGYAPGIGAAGGHGATAQQLEGYASVLYFSGTRDAYLLSDGTDTYTNDAGDDLGVLTAWHQFPGQQGAAYFGDNLASGVQSYSPAGAVYVQTTLGVGVVDADVGDEIDGQTSPNLLPLLGTFFSGFALDGACPDINRFDSIVALAPAVRGHGFEVRDLPGVSYSPIAASVVHDRMNGRERDVDLTFPFALRFVRSNGAFSDEQVVASFLGSCLEYLGTPPPHPPGVEIPVRASATLAVFPTPFNPRTVVELVIPAAGEVTVDVFDLRGRLVRSLHRGETAAGLARWSWGGEDDSGSAVASGIYFVRAKGEGFELRKKAVLLK